MALVAINLLGEKLEEDDEMTKSSSQITFEEMSQADQRDKSLFSPYEDLAFTMYVDHEVQDLIRKMDHKKQEAVLGENCKMHNINDKAIITMSVVMSKHKVKLPC